MASKNKKIVCYYQNSSMTNPDTRINTIDPKLCTHLNYGFITVSSLGAIEHVDLDLDLAPKEGGIHDGIRKFNDLRKRNPQLKTLVSLIGGGEGSENISPMASKAETRRAFVENIVEFIIKYGFDGLDLVWEYPNQRGGVEADRENYVLLLKELRERFDREDLLLSAAIIAIEKQAKPSYIIPEVVKYLHYINFMPYEIHGPWDNKTGHNAPLYPASWETGEDRLLNVEAGVNYWLSNGTPPEKIVYGVTFYGMRYTLADPNNKGVGAPISTTDVLRTDYKDICQELKKGGWEVKFDEEQRVPYMVKGDQWIGYENEKSLLEKVEYLKKHNFGGVMIWSVERDDIHGTCGRKYPLLNLLNEAL